MSISSIRSTYETAPGFAETFTGSRGQSLLPGGFGRSTFALARRMPMAVQGYGCWVRDDNGRELIDLNNNFTALIHGHAHPQITVAGQRALSDGASFGLPNMHEIHHARLILERTFYLEQVRYCNSGTEAVMLAVRLARAVTGRNKVVFVRSAYHGTADLALVPGGHKSRRGIPEGVVQDSIEVAINDVRGLDKVFEARGKQIAAVVIDPMPNRAGLIAATPEFLDMARRRCNDTGALLVSDEVIGIRQAYSGVMHANGVDPDLLITGKIIGGGLPIGAVLGRTEIMENLSPLSPQGLEHGGTFSANPVSMATGVEALRLFSEAEVGRLNQMGEKMRGELRAKLDGCGWEVRGGGSLLRLFPQSAEALVAKDMQISLWWESYDRGLLLMQNGLASLSTPMDERIAADVVDRLVDAAKCVSGMARTVS
ncbi:aspartate aminotransferase family protein [Arthrobacter sp. 2MCAF15]|uniref:aspartate aminotransferase family protein n=1 Tax=Arthrobacter sp. 2MCAF15 TaxID=3232984 RepID=UPI003F932AF0